MCSSAGESGRKASRECFIVGNRYIGIRVWLSRAKSGWYWRGIAGVLSARIVWVGGKRLRSFASLRMTTLFFAGDERGGTGAATGDFECADSLGGRDASEILRFAQDDNTPFCG